MSESRLHKLKAKTSGTGKGGLKDAASIDQGEAVGDEESGVAVEGVGWGWVYITWG